MAKQIGKRRYGRPEQRHRRRNYRGKDEPPRFPPSTRQNVGPRDRIAMVLER
jgi:hypothetical protein